MNESQEENVDLQEIDSSSEKGLTRQRVNVEKVLSDYRVTKLSDHLETIKGYYVLGNNKKEGLKYTDFKGVVDFHEQKVSGLNKFLESIGLIKVIKGKPGHYLPTEKLIDFQRSLEWGDEAKAKQILRDILKDTWFFNSVNSLLRMKNKASLEVLVNKLGLDSGAKKGLHDNSLKILIGYLKYVELIREEEGEYLLSDSVQSTEHFEDVQPAGKTFTDRDTVRQEPNQPKPIKPASEQKNSDMSAHSQITLSINIPSDITEERLDVLFRKIKEHFIAK